MFRIEKFLASLSVSRKLNLGFGLAIGLMVFAAIISLSTSRTNQRRVEEMIRVDAVLAADGAEARSEVIELRRFEKDAFLNFDNPTKVTEYEAKWNAALAVLERNLASIEKISVSAVDRDAVNKMRDNVAAYTTAFKKILGEIRAGAFTSASAANTAISPFKEPIRQLDETMNKFAKEHQDKMTASSLVIEKSISSALLLTLVLSIMALLGAGVIAFVLARAIRKPLSAAVASATEVAQGRFVIDAPEELGQVQQAFNGVRDLLVETRALKEQVENDNRELQRSITELLRAVANASDGDLTVRAPVSAGALGNVADAFNSLLESLQDLLTQVATQILRTDTIVNAVKDAANKMSVGATTQSVELIDASQLVERLSAAITKVSEGANVAVAAAKRTEVSAAEGSKAVEDVIVGMGTLRANVQAGAKKMKNLGDRSMEITGIVATISRISEQTNMLALNAAIEAARAGEHGRGFSVVAEEVRKLAERTAAATRDIDRLVKAIHIETNETVTAIEQQTHVVEQEAEAVGEAGQSLRKIHGASTESSAVVFDISTIAREQAQRTGVVVTAIGRISSIARETEQGAAATATTVLELAAMSKVLQKSVARFKVV
jgi:methyl-accepting chemotaxis protein